MKNTKTIGFGLAGIGVILMGYGISKFMKLNKEIDRTSKVITEQTNHIKQSHQQFVDECVNQHNRFVRESNMMHQQAVMQHQDMLNHQMQMQMMNMF